MPETPETRRPRAWLWFVLYGILVLTGLSIGSCYFNTGADRAKFWVEGLLSAGVLSVVIVQAVIYSKQWHVMDAQTEYANRAYVCIPAGNMDVFDELKTGKQVMVFKLKLENTGQTPANDVQVVSFTDIAKEVPDPALLVPGEKYHGGLIAPHAHNSHWVRAPQPTSEQNQRWVDGDLEIYCSGLITYQSFGKIRTTKFCFLRRPGTMQLQPYGKWNKAD